jgi:peptidoglycan/xylan/chitin deacetylase (PgdA/CDA1 family)
MKRLTKIILTVITVFILSQTVLTTDISAAGAKIEKGDLIILMYHEFRKDNLEEDDDPAYVTTDVKFKRDIEKFQELGYKSLSLEKLYREDYDPLENYFIITFDDGYLGNYTVAFPVLKEKKVYADIFMCTESTALANHFKYAQAREMEESGYVKIYSHLTTHVSALSYTLQKFNTIAARSYNYLYNRLSEDRLQIMAYPYGLYSRETVESLHKSGTVYQLVESKLKVAQGENPWNPAGYGILYRVNVEYEADIENLIEVYKEQFCST